MTLNWNAAFAAGGGAVAGALVGALVQGYRNKPLESAVLVTASLGAIVGAAFAPRGITAHQVSFPPTHAAT